MTTLPATAAWFAPAKLNLFLHITARRADGYHLLQSVFQFLDYGDTLYFEVTAGGAIERVAGNPQIPPAQDLVCRAAQRLQQYAGVEHGVRIRIDKRLPLGGGLGGGSSDAATTLVALNQLWGCGLDDDTLAELGLQLGADVPVFVRGQAAWAEGVGEQLQPLDDLPEPWYVVLAPAVSVSTAEVFSDSQLNRTCPAITIRDFLAGRAGNVCEAVVCRRYPEVARALAALSHYGPARMTGTGACVFAPFESEQAARQAWTALSKHWQGFVARGCNRSPLYTNRAE
ncbi:MAG: 4-(cytidine 5'-diphospho)-2-C-methyl-D-erythritol kinase [Gammaproteobacteria bacterium]